MKKTGRILATICALALSAGTAFAAEHARKIETFKMHGLTVHTYNSSEGMLDGSVVFETDKALVLLESQSMPQSSKELKDYIDGLKKPLAAVIASYHGAGLTPYAGVPIYGSRATVEFAQNGGEAALFKYFASIVPGFDTTVTVPNRVITGGTAEIGGIEFALDYHDAPAPAPGMTVAIPSAKVVYLHMLGGDTHSIIGSKEGITDMIVELQKTKRAGYELILTSHHSPEKPAALDRKIAYLERAEEILSEAETKEAFIAAMKAAFPNYLGEGYLEMSAENLYKQQ